MDGSQPMEMDNQNEVDIVAASETRLRIAEYTHWGIWVDLYQFPNDLTKTWKHGEIFQSNRKEELSFESSMGYSINALDSSNKKDAGFLVHEESMQKNVENMLIRSFKVKHDGILRPYGVGYNTQISKVVSAYRKPTRTFEEWLQAQNPSSTSIPPVVQQLLRTGYQAIVAIWEGGYSSDSLADPASYVMINNRIKIDMLCIRDRKTGDTMMKLRFAFADLIQSCIHPKWKDDELIDLIDLLKIKNAWKTKSILGAPVLLLPKEREPKYFQYHKAGLFPSKQRWLEAGSNLGGRWKIDASNEDTALKSIIDYQEKQAEDNAKPGSKMPVVGFTPDLKGALHFASVVNAHYHQHFKNTPEAERGVDPTNRKDQLLKKVLARLLSRRYNADYIEVTRC